MKLFRISVLFLLLFACNCTAKKNSDFSEQTITEQEINHVQSSLKDLNKLQQTIAELEKNRSAVQNEFTEQKLQIEKLEKSLTEYENELKRQKNSSVVKDEIIATKNNEISILKKNIEKLEKTDSYNEHKQLKSLESKYKLLQKQQDNLMKEQSDLQKDIERIEQQNIQLAKEASEWKSKYEDFEKNFNLRVKEEKSKLRSRYNEKLTKITEDIENKKNINSEKIDLKKGQPVGKIIEILEGKITFRFDNDSFCKQITNGDKLNVVRNLAGNSVSVGTLEVTNVSPFSTFGRATVDSLKSGMNIHTGDFLVIKNKN
jgi:chromosome segregation ATPase